MSGRESDDLAFRVGLARSLCTVIEDAAGEADEGDLRGALILLGEELDAIRARTLAAQRQ